MMIKPITYRSTYPITDRASLKPDVRRMQSASMEVRFGTNTSRSWGQCIQAKLNIWRNIVQEQWQKLCTWIQNTFHTWVEQGKYWIDALVSKLGLKSVSSKPVRAPSILPLLRLEDFKIPEGLETPEKRITKTVDLVNAVFPQFIEFIKARDTNPHWKGAINKVLNEEFNKQICPNGHVSIDYHPGRSEKDDSGLGTAEGFFESVRLKDCVPQHRFYTPEQLNTPRYYLGHIDLRPLQYINEKEWEASVYDTLIHEVNHIIRAVAHHPQRSIDEWFSIQKRISETPCSAGGNLFSDYLKQFNISWIDFLGQKTFFEKDLIEIVGYIQPFFKHVEETYPHRNIEKEAFFQYFKKSYLDTFTLEELKIVLRRTIENECEANLAANRGFQTQGKKSLYLNNIDSAICAYGLQVMIRTMEAAVLKTPPSECSQLPDIAVYIPNVTQKEGDKK